MHGSESIDGPRSISPPVTPETPRRSGFLTARRGEWLVAYLFLLPALIGLLVFRLYPIGLAIWGSLHQTTFGGAAGRVYVGFENYLDLADNPIFWDSLWVTLKLNLIINPLQVTLALLLAVLANQKIRGITFYRTIFFIPIGVSVPITAIIWRMMVDPNSGLINAMLLKIGLPAQPFLTSSNQALATIIAIATWTGISFWMVFLLAGLQNIPGDLIEASTLDGASAIQRFFHITLPLMKRTVLFVLATCTAINFLLFAPVYILTRGGPSLSTNTLMYESFKTSFIYGDMGSGLAMVVVLLLIVLITVAMEFWVLRAEK